MVPDTERLAAAARRPLIDREGGLAGFEFPLPTVLARRLAQGGGDAVLAAHASALFAAMQPAAASGRVALARLPLAVLAQPAALARAPAGCWLVLDAAAFDAPGNAVLAPLRAAGVVLGTAQVPQRGASFVYIDATGLDRAAAAAAVAACRAAAPRSRVVASGLADVADVEAVLAAGADLAAGHLDRLRTMPAAAALPTSMVRVSRLLNQVVRDDGLAAIAAELRADVGLSYELLRHANSPLLGLRRKVDALDQAVMLLGRDMLYRWLCARLLAAAPGRSSSRALLEVALARAALFERLAPACGAPPAALYTVGLLSLLDVMVPMPMAQALAPLNLPPEAQAALVRREGPWGSLLTLAACLDSGDLEGAAAPAAAYGGLDEVMAANAEAWAYAAQTTAMMKPAVSMPRPPQGAGGTR